MEQQCSNAQSPLEYWLKYADEIMTAHINQVLEDYGFTHSRWQVFNRVYEAGTIVKRDIFDAMKLFTGWLDEIIDGLIQEGWVTQQEDGDTTILMLTEMGKTEHEAILTLQREITRRVLYGITEQDHTTTVTVLQHMVKNLEEVMPTSTKGSASIHVVK